MTNSHSRLKVEESDGVILVEFLDKNILDEANIQQIGDELAGIVDSASKPSVLINFQNVEHLSSAALGTLITINNRIAGKDGKLVLSEIEGQILEVFKITKLDRLFDIHETNAEALASFS